MRLWRIIAFLVCLADRNRVCSPSAIERASNRRVSLRIELQRSVLEKINALNIERNKVKLHITRYGQKYIHLGFRWF
jgi:hypothetical protein